MTSESHREGNVRSEVKGATCRCGHPEATHYGENTGAPGGSCHATVYTVAHNGGDASPCPCRKFDADTREGALLRIVRWWWTRESFFVRFWTTFPPLLAVALVILWLR